MANPYFSKTGNPEDNSSGSSALARAEFSLVEAAFEKFPVPVVDELARVNAGGTALESSGVTAKLMTAFTGMTATFATPGDLNVVYATPMKCQYVRLGPFVMLWLSVFCSTFTHTTASGNFKLEGLPIPSAASNDEPYMGQCVATGISTSYTNLSYMNISASEIYISKVASGQAGAFIDTTNLPTGSAKNFIGMLVYRAL